MRMVCKAKSKSSESELNSFETKPTQCNATTVKGRPSADDVCALYEREFIFSILRMREFVTVK